MPIYTLSSLTAETMFYSFSVQPHVSPMLAKSVFLEISVSAYYVCSKTNQLAYISKQ